ncbi:uncharacterized protein EV420DRAFT_8760 [Desarmillaria tabescens]|uniref:Uncharacterized protein n=1 Tax=Armillaria tabescens TaxID=1929756 RepID=A0AA39TXA1_ARMTA|nr:uncharacterized protein EV420DRAFT_8760 [Desarmillaria tabescens]KAK0469108.1 hypothetical protein EV420DRAFT_8760 [Desarmillaria tabescens]
MAHPQVYMAVEKYDQSPHSFTIPKSSSPSPSSSRQHLNHSFLPLPPAEKRRISGLRSALDVVKALVLPVVAIGYLAFCYSVHNHIAPVTGEGIVDLSSYSLANVKSGITAISILVVSIGLWPMKSLVQDLHSEEFFRVLTAHQAGVPLSTINTISSPSFGTFNSFMAIARRHCSSYFTLSFISSFIVLAASSLAPSALSVDSMLVDGQVLAFSVGAVSANSALNVSDIDAFTFQMPAENVRRNTQEAAAIAWAESSLRSQYMFRLPSNGTSYIIPIPENLPTTTSARWLTDVVALNPSCAWQQTNVSSTLQISSNTTSNNTSFLSDDVYVNMPAVSTDIKLPWNTILLICD